MDQKPDDAPKQVVPVHTILPAEDEDALFDAQMQQMEQIIDKTPEPVKEKVTHDPILDREIEKRLTLEKIMFLSQPVIKEFEYGGLKFQMKLIKAEDNARILKAMSEAKTDEVYRASLMGVAASILTVNGIDLEDFFAGPPTIHDPLLKKYDVIRNWPPFLTTFLTACSSQIQSDTQQEFTKDFLKK